MEILSTHRHLVPVRRLFPIWRYGQRHYDVGWYPDWYETREFPTFEEAREFVRAYVEDRGCLSCRILSSYSPERCHQEVDIA